MKTLSQFSDRELIHLFMCGNRNAFDQLAKRHKERIYISILCLVKDRYTTEDILQDVFLKILVSIKNGSYQEEGKFLPWALRIAHNLSLDHLRIAKRTLSMAFDLHRDGTIANPFYEESTEVKLSQAQHHKLLLDLMVHLPEEQRKTVQFRCFNDMSFKEIADVSNCNINTALGRMRYGVLKLRKLLLQQQVI